MKPLRVGDYDAANKVVTIDGYVMIEPNEEALTEAIAIAPVASAMILGFHFFMYESGVYDDPTCESESSARAVGVVGYGATSNGTEYYIVKHTLSTAFGMDGYMLLARNAHNMCDIANSLACYAVIKL